MDIEIIDPSFFHKLQNRKLYISGTFGSIGVENSILIAKDGYNEDFWSLLKIFTKEQVYNTDKINSVENVIFKTGPISLSTFLLKRFKSISPSDNSIQILPWELFGQPNQDLSYVIHHYTNNWHPNKN